MEKEIFLRLYEGVTTTHEDEIKYLNNLVDAGILKIVENQYFLDTKYKIGIIELQRKFAILKDLSNEHRNIKLEFENLGGALDGDLVIVKRSFNPRSQSKSKVIKIINSKNNAVLVFVKDKKLYTVKESILLKNEEFKDLQEGDVLIFNNKESEIIENIGNLNDASVDEKISLFLYAESYRLTNKIDVDPNEFDLENFGSRVDLTQLPFCTIDPATAKDHDDAIYYDAKASVLYVAIADVSYFVEENSPLDQLAFQKSTSIYLPHKVLPMLPASLSEELCSLKEDVNRFAYVFKIYLDKNNHSVVKSEYFEAVIKSHKKFSYGRIDRVLEGHLDQYSQTEKEIFDYILPLYEVTKAIRQERLKTGYDFRTLEYRQRLNNNYEVESISTEESTASHQLVEECMLLANIEASKKVNTVGIYRVHEEPSFEAISKLVDLVNTLGISVKMQANVHETILAIQKKARSSYYADEIDELIIQSQVQAHYSSTNLGHFGLGFKSYSHFTSPIRRYSDLVLHRMLKTKETPENIDDVCAHISNQQRKVDQLVWDFEDRKYARWASKHIGEEFKARIVDAEKGIAKFYKEMPGLRVFLDNFKAQLLFTKLKVVIKEVDIVSKTIIASIKY
ncbi:MAG: RNB domain-containing ribonuclease [Candidatus Marinarcus sp.]|uniref:RNB domain-containing ribonuclease n=1 Tax=Candidatus Marinarcus sp. TaxID=3100987 RepID=UPI003B002715